MYVKCTSMVMPTCLPPDLTEVAPLNISGKFKIQILYYILVYDQLEQLNVLSLSCPVSCCSGFLGQFSIK